MNCRCIVWVTAVVVVAAFMSWVAATPAPADEVVYEGLGPGFWRHNVDEWWVHWPDHSLSNIFPNTTRSLRNCTMMDALCFGGGRGVEGAQKILLRAVVAAVLNQAHPLINYPLGRGELMEGVNRALGTGDRKTMLQLADLLDEYNNLGVQW